MRRVTKKTRVEFHPSIKVGFRRLSSSGSDLSDNLQECHLQEAMVAQAASTAGITENNHFIPTPRVEPTDENRYSIIYPKIPPPPKQLIKVQGNYLLIVRCLRDLY